MSEVPYVSTSIALQVAEWERRFERLPSSSGLLFVSITPKPGIGGFVHEFDLLLGFNKELADVGLSLAKHVLAEEIEKFAINVRVARGLACASARSGSGGDPG
jgi:hypothetical protein